VRVHRTHAQQRPKVRSDRLPAAARPRLAHSRIPAHYHKKATETFLFLEGDFTDDGTQYESGTYFACEPNTVHGPHSTEDGATLLVFQTVEVDATDFFLADGG